MKKKNWFKLKRYPHIGIPVSTKQIPTIVSYITNPECIRKHAFTPFIYSPKETRRFRKTLLANGKKSKIRAVELKKRPILYANNIDSNIFSYYSSIINKKYESKLIDSKLDQVVTAYRPIPLDHTKVNGRNKCNVDFAEEIFNLSLIHI